MVKHILSRFARICILLLVVPFAHATAGVHTATPTADNVRYIGAVTCQSSMCHGGASPSRDQFTIWSRDDFHSRAYATLVTARSTQIAEGAGISNATTDARCTTCHASHACARDVAPTATPGEGVSCENCHGAASFWLRGHTRTDWTDTDRIHAGMRDLRSAYVRAETCVKCHQVIDSALLKAGHLELTFELDGQTASEPRHWTEKEDWFGPKAWLVGQAVALREISEHQANHPNSNLAAQQDALYWLLQHANVFMKDPNGPNADAARIAAWSNQVAQAFSGKEWKPAFSSEILSALSSTSANFTDDAIPVAERELRAERLVLGLDRLFKSLHGNQAAPGSAELAALFSAVQDRDRFDAPAFAQALQKFADAIAPTK